MHWESMEIKWKQQKTNEKPMEMNGSQWKPMETNKTKQKSIEII